MRNRAPWVLVMGSVLSAGCAAGEVGPSVAVAPSGLTAAGPARGPDASGPALAALRAGSFDQAEALARETLARDAANPRARLVRAAVRYKKTVQQLSLDLQTAVLGVEHAGRINHKYLRGALADAESDLAAVDADLAVAGSAPDLAVELCLACWEIDWNGDGRIDERDRRLFQIERDGDDEIPEGDPRRKPTFRFDVGDVAWARAFVGFQRAALDVVLAYDGSALDALLGRGARPETVVLRLLHADRIAGARARFLEALDRSDEARRAYLAETDDDREWVPSPRQRSHPMPLPVDQALYDTWEGALGDLRRLVRGDEGLAAADLVKLGGSDPKRLPRGYIDVGGMLAHPGDITLNVGALKRAEDEGDVASLLAALFGERYVPEMKASPLTRRLLRMKGEVDRSQEGFERKLRYLFWLN